MEKDMNAIVREKYDKKAAGYDCFLAPMEKMAMAKWRKELCSKARGLVLEAGVGTGANFPYYPEGVKVVGVDFSPKMLERAQNRLSLAKTQVELKLADIQDLPFPDNTFDSVITACVFCSVPDAIKGFKELRRVIKPDGKLFLLEHVRSEGSILGPTMDWLNPFFQRLAGVNINRRTENNIALAGMQVTKVKNLFRDIVKLITAAPNK
ncbi:MAG: class I SAM-dependent methyltransferase [Bacillota bacterium]